MLYFFLAQILEEVHISAPPQFQQIIQTGSGVLLHHDEIKGHRYNVRSPNRPSSYGVSLEVINSDHDLENVVEMLDEDEDITDLTRPSTTPQSTKDYFEKSQVRHTLSVLTYPYLTYTA